MVRKADLRHWYRNPANVTPQEICNEAERRDWMHVRTRGDHVIYRGPRTGRTIIIPLSTKSNATKRSIITDLMQEEGIED